MFPESVGIFVRAESELRCLHDQVLISASFLPATLYLALLAATKH
jgi:hypothetical protein